MSSITFNFPVQRLVRTLAVFCICAMLFVFNGFPAFAASSNPTQGEDKLLGIEKEAQKAVLKQPMGLEETQEKASQGPNEIQGDADMDKMKNASNTNATSFEEQVKNVVENITGKKD
ncbi:low temperature-induced protein [Kamptonema sp. UHCC 0994]|uniref:low temperature-induced protein n=1 Tax=Kamptonema sp. UHCC 0994 TaxID=3031329 RepID=UPI0023B9DF33|nr:low temperature-induced protein [Kamptonema sp. UHCC 0994]MDF0554416.1 low temperature-induced protein [Kamptonema sp. UHCC 0994]